MATKVHMEALSPTMEEGQVVKWLKAEGDVVSNGDILAEIETDKATMELSARGDGILRAILVEEGGTAPVGNVIAVIGANGEDISELLSEVAAGTGAGAAGAADAAVLEPATTDVVAEAGPEEARETAPTTGSLPAPTGVPADRAALPPVEATGAPGRVKASPIARRLAEEAGVDLGTIAGTGPGGRVIRRDVEEAREGAKPSSLEYEDVPLTQMRKTIARRLVESLSPVPHFFLTVQIDMSRVVESRRSVNELLEAQGARVSVNDFILKATAAALRRHPECNAAWHGDSIRCYRDVHLAVAVAVEDGLITPVVRNADLKGLVQIGQEVKEMVGRAHQKRLKPEEYTGATFSVSNLGMFGIHEFTAIINPPEAGILAIGRLEEQPVVIGGEVVARPRMRVTMSCDHRVIDGATGARFLQTLTSMLEEPTTILI